jgi:hypothetical protein
LSARRRQLNDQQHPPGGAAGLAGLSGQGSRRPAKAPWLLAVVVVVVVVVAGVAVAVANPFSTGGTNRSGPSANSDPTSLSTVARRDLTSQTQVPATLGYVGSYSVVNEAQGTMTAVPAVGQVVKQGQVLYQVTGLPVVLLYGQTPAYRTLSEGVSGADVAELNADLVSLGYATATALPSGSAEFTYWTQIGVERLQAALGETQSGTLSLGQAVFEAGALRVTQVQGPLGAPVQPGQPVLSATSTTRQVSIALDAAQQSEVAVGDNVTITLPNDRTTPGVISSVGTVATAPASGTSNSSPSITVLVSPNDPAATGTWDQAPVNVTITTASVTNVLVVPVDALLAQPGGADAVEVVGANGVHHLAPVTLGLFDDADGLVQVSGSELAVGQRVVVPKL